MSDKLEKPTESDVGAAFLLWYAEVLQEYPDGLITQAQAAKMLGIGRMAVNRLVSRGYLRAVYFPKAPTVPGVVVGEDDSTWLRLTAWFGKWLNKLDMPETCYVAFGDVVELWLRGDTAKKCRLEWRELITRFRSKQENVRELHRIADSPADEEQAERLIRIYGMKLGQDMAPLERQKVYLHDELLNWFDQQASQCGLSRNQLMFWALEQWKRTIAGEAPEIRLPSESEVWCIEADTKKAVMEQCRRGRTAMWIRASDELGGDLGTYGATGLRFDGGVD
ncbi:hypothetical protein GC163_22180 [bacterium]|nr:hypothetical protein [bacterium]